MWVPIIHPLVAFDRCVQVPCIYLYVKKYNRAETVNLVSTCFPEFFVLFSKLIKKTIHYKDKLYVWHSKGK
jgi:hypothetical protein